MKRQRLFKVIDIVIYFNIVLFIGSSVLGFQQNNSYGVIFILIAVLNILFITMTIRLRLAYNKSILVKIGNEWKAEESLSSETRKEFNQAKQEFLESRIETEIQTKMANAKIIRNAYIPRADGSTSEIDLIVLCELGVFIIEAKNITGKIVGNWKQDKSLIVQHPGGSEFNIVNPIEQNTQHYYSLRNYLGIKSDLYRSIVVFGDLSYLENSYKTPYHAEVCQLDGLIESMNRIAKRYGTKLEDHMVDSVYKNLIKFVEYSDVKKEKHLQNIK